MYTYIHTYIHTYIRYAGYHGNMGRYMEPRYALAVKKLEKEVREMKGM